MTRKSNVKIRSLYPNKVYIFICEDEKSMCYYLKGIKPYLKSNIKIEIKHSNEGNTAKKVYKCAKKAQDYFIKSQDAYPKGFKVVACFDKDQNKLSDICEIMNAKKNNKKDDGIAKIYNNPCYEYWLYLHTVNKAPIFYSSMDCAQKCLTNINKKYKTNFENTKDLKNNKGIFEIVKMDYSNAVKNADSRHFTDYDNTYTNAQIILDEIVDKNKIV